MKAIMLSLTFAMVCALGVAQDLPRTLSVCGSPEAVAGEPCATVPKVVHRVDPEYSDEARRKKITGSVVLSLIVGKDGVPRDVTVTNHLGGGLDEQSVKAVEQWRFQPATLDGQPVATQIRVETTFRLYDKQPEHAPPEIAVATGNDADQLYRQGDAAFRAKDYAAAAAAYRRVVELKPKHLSAWNDLCRADYELNRMDEAVAACKKQIEITPDDKNAHNNLGRVLWAQGKHDAAEAEFRKQIDIVPDNKWSHGNLGMLLRQEGHCDIAIPELETAYKIDPNYAFFREGLRDCYKQTGQTDKAQALPATSTAGVIGGIVSSDPLTGLNGAQQQRVRIGSGVADRNVISKVQPVYPPIAREARIQGSCVLKALINKQGNVADLTAISGHPLLLPAAIDAVKQWRFNPYYMNGQPVEVETQVTVNFELH
jgi:TonB family protein